jgi:CRP-like cAMP-binding protein
MRRLRLTPGEPAAAALLGAQPILRHLPSGKIAALARESHIVHAPRGSAIARRGERPAGLGVVARGLAKLALKGETEKVIRLAGPGDSFGEELLFTQRSPVIDITALVDTVVLMVPRAPLLRVLENDPRSLRAVLVAVCGRLDALLADLEAVTLHGARERLAAFLDALAAEGKATLPASKTVVAARLGITKETLSRLLHRFADEGLIEVNRREIRLLDRARLAAAAGGG